MNFKTALIVLSIAFFSACKSKNVEPPANLLEEYFPLVKGSYVVYDAQRISFTNMVSDTFNFQIKEVNKGEYESKDGETNYRIERFKRTDATKGWEIDSVWYVIDKKDKIFKVENNYAFLKMVYPVAKETKWDVNVLNYRQYEQGGYYYKMKDEASYDNIGKSYVIGSKSFPITVTVNQEGIQSAIDSVVNVNVYAKGIGRIYMNNISVSLCSNDSTLCEFRQIIDGSIYTEKYVEHGKEE